VLLVLALAMSLLLPGEFFIVLAGYFVVTLAYSFGLKRLLMADVIVLAGLYTVRIIAGAAAVSIVPSFWLLAFSMFLFLSLAIVKRYSELVVMQAAGKKKAENRSYHSVDLQALLSLGSASGYISVLVFALFINSKPIRNEYATPEVLWLACPLLLYWISRIWILTRRGDMHDDPVIFTMQDRASLLTMVLIGAIFSLASYYTY
jgi:4-hydroxybenzoate polyprenyltransferase